MEKEIKKKKPVHHNPKKSENKEEKVEKPEVEIDFSAAENLKPGRYFEAIGRRKTAVARVRIFAQGEKDFLVNGKPYKKYFSTIDLQQTADNALSKMKCLDRFKVVAQVKGGGLNAQAEAVRHGTARALVDFNADFRKRLRRVGYLTRDPRKRERKKFGLKRARRAPQWNKR